MSQAELRDLVHGAVKTLRNANVDGAALVMDDGAATALAAVGGVELAMRELGALAVLPFPNAQDSSVGKREIEAAKRTLEEWERSVAKRRNLNEPQKSTAKDSSRPIKIYFVVSDMMWEKEAIFGTLLGGDFSSTWIQARILCTVSSRAHNSRYGKPENGLDFTQFGISVQQLAKPNKVEIKVEHLEWNMSLHLNDSEFGLAAFSIANDRLSRMFPVTRCRLALFHKQDIDDIDGNQDLPSAFKSDIKLLAHTLCSILRDELNLDVSKSSWAYGFTSRLLGNALLQYAEDLEEVESRSGARRNRRRASLVLMDRTIDMTSALSEDRICFTQMIHNTLGDSAYCHSSKSLSQVESKFGKLSLNPAFSKPANDLLSELARRGPSQQRTVRSELLSCNLTEADLWRTLNSKLKADICYLENISFYQSIAACALALGRYQQTTHQRTLEHILKEGSEVDHILLPLVDLLNKNNTSLGDILRLSVIAHSIAGNSSHSEIEKGVLDTFGTAFLNTLRDSDPKDQVWNLLAGASPEHVMRVFHELLTTRQNKNDSPPSSSCLRHLILQAFDNQPSMLEGLGESALEKTAADIGNMFMGMFGLTSDQSKQSSATSPQKSTKKRRRLNLDDTDVCVVFVTGGISLDEANQVLEAASQLHRNTEFIFGGTCISTPAQQLFRLFERQHRDFM